MIRYDQIDWWNPRPSLLQNAAFKFEYFQEKIGPLSGARILDLGRGGGILAEEFAKRGALVTGIDHGPDGTPRSKCEDERAPVSEVAPAPTPAVSARATWPHSPRCHDESR